MFEYSIYNSLQYVHQSDWNLSVYMSHGGREGIEMEFLCQVKQSNMLES